MTRKPITIPEMRGQAGEDDRWQRAIKGRLLAPTFDAMRLAGVIEDWRPTELSEQVLGDTFLKMIGGDVTSIEEKIVRWPGYEYTAITLETMSCTVPGRERAGWMVTSRSRWLLHVRVSEDELSAYCDVISFRPLRNWFAEQDHKLWPLWESKQINRTHCRIVPLLEIREAVEAYQFSLPTLISGLPPFMRVGYVKEEGGHLVHYCAECGGEARFGHGVSLLSGKLGTWYCREHRPQPAGAQP